MSGHLTDLFFFLFQFDKKEKLSYKRTNTTHKYFKVSGTNNRVKTLKNIAVCQESREQRKLGNRFTVHTVSCKLPSQLQ
jgi:hypothetical protein